MTGDRFTEAVKECEGVCLIALSVFEWHERHLPLGTDMWMIKLLANVCREIAHNGLKKIVLVNAHGGNFGLVALYNRLQLYTPRHYVVYLVNPFMAALSGQLTVPWPEAEDVHAGPGKPA